MKRVLCLVACTCFVFAPTPGIAGESKPEQSKGKPALLVMDMQNAFLPYMDEGDIEIGTYMINATIELFRQADLPVIRVYHTDPKRGPKPGTDEFQFPDTIAVKDDDPKIVKNYPSAFKKTDLSKTLDELECDTVFLCGLSSVGCVLATYFEARGLEYNTFMVKGALISHRSDLTDSVEEITEAVGYEVIQYLLTQLPH